MTHDELLAKIEAPVHLLMRGDSIPHYLLLDQNNALRAVVELHKPIIHALPDETCLACQDLYPCPTIKAIERELNGSI